MLRFEKRKYSIIQSDLEPNNRFISKNIVRQTHAYYRLKMEVFEFGTSPSPITNGEAFVFE
ncbi:hypothetical protein Nstercoris_02314 (plasmid) [Nitrosomonas stercoris]|uniref:Uncharacterized protein n=1 Tax=Nitrosomonas stercoris TaxID=1444684 RepID=A0A4Y1YTB9_9PROT|nr:hypothetical protein Nstercoris_02314 [Nitrosomonas stercoris]